MNIYRSTFIATAVFFLFVLNVSVFADDITLTTISPGGGGNWSYSTDTGHENDIYAVNSIGTLDRVGIGTTEPDFKLHVSAPNGSGSVGIDGYGGASPGYLYLRQAQGTQDAPTATGDSQNIGLIGFRGYAGTGFTTDRARIQAYSVQPWTATAQGTALAFSTTPVGSTTMQQRVFISPEGNLGVGDFAPHERVDVAGGIMAGMAPAAITELSSAMTSSVATATVASTTGYPSAGTILIDNEAMFYTGTTATTFTGLTRGVFGTTAAAHTSGKAVDVNFLTASNSESTMPVMSVNSAGNVGINTPGSEYNLHICPAPGSDIGRIVMDGFGSGYEGGKIAFRRASGTKTAPTAVEKGDYLGVVTFTGYMGTGYPASRAAIGAWASDNWTATDQGAGMVFYTTPVNTIIPVLSLSMQWFNVGNGKWLDFTVGDGGAGRTARTITDVLKLRPRSTAPSGPSNGDMYYNVNGGLYIYSVPLGGWKRLRYV